MVRKVKYLSTKTYGHEVGLSAAFRQWRANSHCKYLHGYALSFRFVFEAEELNNTNWVVDFGGMKSLKHMLQITFDHKTIVAEDDPHLDWFMEAQRRGILDLTILPSAGCEKFAQYVYEAAEVWLREARLHPRVRLVSVEVSEHGANSAIYKKE